MRSMVEGARGGDAAVSAVVDFPVRPELRPYLEELCEDLRLSVGEPQWRR